MEAQILQPVIVLVAWTLLILLWMLATRIPYSIKNNISPQEGAHATDISSKLPSGVRQIIENYKLLKAFQDGLMILQMLEKMR